MRMRVERRLRAPNIGFCFDEANYEMPDGYCVGSGCDTDMSDCGDGLAFCSHRKTGSVTGFPAAPRQTTAVLGTLGVDYDENLATADDRYCDIYFATSQRLPEPTKRVQLRNGQSAAVSRSKSRRSLML
ncbi:MAG: hypothetical protein R3A47_05050 [Polyangiales bacterium]